MNEHLKDPEILGEMREIKIHTQQADVLITHEAMVYGAFAYRLVTLESPTPPGEATVRGWTVTHLATGRKLTWWWEEEGSVKGFLEAVHQHFRDAGVDPWISDHEEAIRVLRPHKPRLMWIATLTKAAGTMEITL